MTKSKKQEPKQTAFEGMVEESGMPTENEGVEMSMIPSSGGNQLSMEDMQLPQLKVGQGLTPEVIEGEYKAGDLIITGFEGMREATVVPLIVFKQRILIDDDTRDILCRSENAVTGEGTPGGECAECPLSKWTGGGSTGERRTPPPCTEYYRWLMYSVDHAIPVMMDFRKTAMPTGKLINTLAMSKGFGNFGVRISARKKDGPRGAYYVPAASMDPSVTGDDIALAKASLGMA